MGSMIGIYFLPCTEFTLNSLCSSSTGSNLAYTLYEHRPNLPIEVVVRSITASHMIRSLFLDSLLIRNVLYYTQYYMISSKSKSKDSESYISVI